MRERDEDQPALAEGEAPETGAVTAQARRWLERVQARIGDADLARAEQHACEAEAALRAAPPLRRHLARVRVLVMMLRDWRAGRYEAVPWRTLAGIAALLLYLANPLDLIPDFLPGVGYADDLAIIALVWAAVRRDVEKYAAWKLACPAASTQEAATVREAFPHLAPS